MKKLILVVAMVLLSTSAWACDWCNDPEYQAQKLGMGNRTLPLNDRSGVSFTAPDPTALFTSIDKFCEEKCSVRHSDKWVTIYSECEQQCLSEYKQKEPWADSRYRLENNDITGHYRIMENVNGKWQVIIRSWSGSDLGSSPSDHYYTKEEMDYHLERLRKKEREDKAWRPIK